MMPQEIDFHLETLRYKNWTLKGEDIVTCMG